MCASARNARILIASADLALSQLRKQALEKEPGWQVVISRNKQHALALLYTEEFDALLLDNSVTYDARLEFAGIFRQKNPPGKVVVIEGKEKPEVPFDAILNVPVTPLDLFEALRRLLGA